MSEQAEVDTRGATPGGGAEGELISESQWGAVRALFERGVSRKAIARELGLDVKTVRKWLRRSLEPQRRRVRGRLLDRFAELLRARALEVGFNAAVLLRELREQGYMGSYATLRRYVAPWRVEQRREELGTVRFETGPGEQAQVDWGSSWVWLGEERVRVHLFVMVLGYSRRVFARAYRSEGLDALLDAHERAFEHFGGRTRTLLYDNPRTIVLAKDEASGAVTWNPTFEDRMDFYGAEIRLCRYYRAQTKGKVESGVKYVKCNALAGKRFADLDALNAWLVEWCLTVADTRVHGTTHERPAERFAREEAAVLVPVDARRPVPRERVESRIVPRDGDVAVESNRYPVPLGWAGRRVEVRIRAEQVEIGGEGLEPVHYPRLTGKHQVARWSGPARRTVRLEGTVFDGPPRLDPAFLGPLAEVDVRSLAHYDALAEVAS
jgi:transposase